jgi:long-chain-fatty-acid--[acyl-carrier-protein] ligase
MVQALLPSSYLIKKLTAKRTEAVVVSTSGTETMPKCVPLSHENILFDLRACLNALELYEDDRLLSMLPPFHSFGLVITGLLPLLSGLRVHYFPNTTDSNGMARAVAHWKISLICSSPTLIKNMLLLSKSSQLSSLRMVISGGAKPREGFFALLHQLAPQAQFIEGYGAAECGPVICINSTIDRKNGVGTPLAGIKLMVVNPDNLHEARSTNELGLILVSGPTVFSSYLNKEAHNPFIDIDNARWYQTGDLGKFDRHGNLILIGRLKRFVLIEKEMVSLSAIEEVLASHGSFAHKLYAVMAEHALFHKVRLVLFTDFPININEVNQILAASGLSSHIDRVIRLETIPLTITGRVSYRTLEKMLHSEHFHP